MRHSELKNEVLNYLAKEVGLGSGKIFIDYKLKLFSVVRVNRTAKIFIILNGKIIKCQIKFCVDKCQVHVRNTILTLPEECRTVRAVRILEREPNPHSMQFCVGVTWRLSSDERKSK